MLNNLLNQLTNILKSQSSLGPIVAIFAGVLTSIMPCSLASIPLIMGYVKGSAVDDNKLGLKLSIIFAFGMTITFVTIGALSAVLGKLLSSISGIWYIAMGLFLILMAIQLWGIYYFVKPNNLINKSTKRGAIGALVSGILAGFFSSPCSTPVIFALVSIVMSSGAKVAYGVLLFLCYALGHSLLTIAAGASSTFVSNMMNAKGYEKASKILEVIIGLLVFFMGVYFIYLGL